MPWPARSGKERRGFSRQQHRGRELSCISQGSREGYYQQTSKQVDS
jgi:hypothetical protein